jgi:DNA-binding NarL/FixJ family response regulator
MLLSEIELRVAELAACGTAVRVIGEMLDVSAEAVSDHLRNVYRKLGSGAVRSSVVRS